MSRYCEVTLEALTVKLYVPFISDNLPGVPVDREIINLLLTNKGLLVMVTELSYHLMFISVVEEDSIGQNDC